MSFTMIMCILAEQEEATVIASQQQNRRKLSKRHSY